MKKFTSPTSNPLTKNAFTCKVCKRSTNSIVLKSYHRKLLEYIDIISRRRECVECGFRQTTVEVKQSDLELLLTVASNDQRRKAMAQGTSE